MLDATGGSSKTAGARSRTTHDPEMPKRERQAPLGAIYCDAGRDNGNLDLIG